MKYAVLIYGGGGWAKVTDDEAKKIYAGHDTFAQKHGAELQGGMELQGPQTAKSIRFRSDTESVVTDGPFAETNEVLGGFYLIEADDLDEAVEIAKDVPVLPGDVLEVRPSVQH
ncbi:MAG: YciI family protein [Actinoallomurus sp.]